MNNLINRELFKALLILFGGIGTNILMGVLIAEIKEKWDAEVFKRGLAKGLAIFVGVFAISIAAQLDNTIVFNDVPIIDYVKNIIVGGYFFYFGQVVLKVVDLIGLKAEKEDDINEA